MSKHLLLLLLISSISNLEIGLGEKEAIELKINSQLEYDKDKNYFKFLYNSPGASYLFFSFESERPGMYVIDPHNQKNEMARIDSQPYAKLEFNGTYYFEIECQHIFCELGGKFSIGFFGSHTEKIDLSQKYYYHPISMGLWNMYLGSTLYRVSGLKEDSIIYFRNLEYNNNGYPYDPSDPVRPDPYQNNLTIFEVLDTATNQTHKNLKIFEFKAQHEYIITIRCLTNYERNQFTYSRFMFFAIIKSNIKTITGEEGLIMSNDKIYGVVNSNNVKDFDLFVDREMERTRIYYANTTENIDDIFKDLNKFKNLNFQSSSNIHITKEENNNIIFIVLPNNPYSGSKLKLYIVNEIVEEYRPSYYVPANTAKIIISSGKERPKNVGFFNYILTYKSQCKNMKVSFSNDDEMTDYIIQNTLPLHIYVSKSDKDCTITTSSYSPKFAFFGAENPYLFNAFYNYGVNMLNINLNNYVKVTQMNARIGSKYLPFYEFYNVYLKQLKVKVNIYIRQLYGGSELYECNADDFNEKILNPLMTPISNVKCKDKKSLFNRLWSLDGTRIISGYLTPDSYFDAYAEIQNDENHVINLSPVMKEVFRYFNNAKYLKKDIEYTLNFDLNHLIKLEPGFDAEIIITNGVQTFKINPENPTIPVVGKSFTIKSNNDAMVYFFGRMNDQIKQLEIKIDESKGKIIKISNFNRDLIMDFGFENYNPSNIPIDTRIRDNKVVYLDNIYEKMKVKLVPDEKFYIYGPSEYVNNLRIEYIDENLNNANNDYNIFLIPENNKKNSIIINTFELRDIYLDFKFCQKDTIFDFYLTSNNEIHYIFTNSNITSLKNMRIMRGDNKLTFETNKPFIFTYSFYDDTDESFERVDYNDRSVFDELIIDEIVDKDDTDDIIKIKFNPNYRQSSTRYIILIAQKNDENTLDNFKNPCFIVDLLNRKPKGVLSDVIYDVGDSKLIEAEVDISNILYDKNEYILNIISQELRFDKKINFYEPKEFVHAEKSDKSDKSDDQKTDKDSDQKSDKDSDQKSDKDSDQKSDKDSDKNSDSDSGTNSNSDGESSKEGGIKGASLALAIVAPILSVIIIGLVIFIILIKRKGASSRDIESLSPLK